MKWRLAQIEYASSRPAMAAALANPETVFVLMTYRGKQLSHSTLAKQVKWRAARAGILPHPADAKVGKENTSQLSPHVLRRSWATLRLEDGVALDAIAEVLNHKDITTTQNHYAFGSSRRRTQTVVEFTV